MVTEAACRMHSLGGVYTVRVRAQVNQRQPGKCSDIDGWPGFSDAPLTLFAQTGNSNEWGFHELI